MSVSKQKVLLNVELYRISGRFIHELRKGQNNPEKVFKHLPVFTLNTNEKANLQPIIAEYFHQFVGIMDDERNEKYTYFNLTTKDANLNEEISNSGIEDLFEDFDFEKVLSVFEPHSGNDIKNFIFPHSNYLVIELTYISSYDYHNGGYDYDFEIDIIGYLNNNLEIQYFDDESIRVEKKNK